MRVLIFANYFHPKKGGLETYVMKTCEGLDIAGHDVHVVTAKVPKSRTKEVVRGITVHRLPTWHLLSGQYPVPKPKALNEWLCKQKKFDIVITHTRFFMISFFGARYARTNRIPHIHVEHGTIRPKSRWWAKPIPWIFDKTLGRYVIKHATVVAGVSKAAERFVKTIYKRKTITLYNCVDTSLFKKTKARKRWKGQIITFVGRLIEAKGVQDLIKATEDIKNVTVLVVGSGNYEGKLKRMARQKVKFLGQKDKEGIKDILSVTDIFVNPSWAEGLPTSVLEAGAMGVPVIATDVGGTREIIDSGKSGYLVKPRNVSQLKRRIKEILGSPIDAKTMGSVLQQKVKNTFDWKVTQQKLIDLVAKLG